MSDEKRNQDQDVVETPLELELDQPEQSQLGMDAKHSEPQPTTITTSAEVAQHLYRQPDIVGIDLGTTNSCVAMVLPDAAGGCVVIPDELGHRIMPSCVAFQYKAKTGTKRHVLVGAAANEQQTHNPLRTFFATKRLLGKQLREVDPRKYPYQLAADTVHTTPVKDTVEKQGDGADIESKHVDNHKTGTGGVVIKYPSIQVKHSNTPAKNGGGGFFQSIRHMIFGAPVVTDDTKQVLEKIIRTIRPCEVNAILLAKLMHCVERKTDRAIMHAVITVPARFNHAQRTEVLDAAQLADIRVVRLIKEPTAAALAYADTIFANRRRAASPSDPERVMVIDIGGGTYDISLLEMFQTPEVETRKSEYKYGDGTEDAPYTGPWGSFDVMKATFVPPLITTTDTTNTASTTSKNTKYHPSCVEVACGGNVSFGGKDIDDKLVDYFCGKIHRTFRVDPRNPKSSEQTVIDSDPKSEADSDSKSRTKEQESAIRRAHGKKTRRVRQLAQIRKAAVRAKHQLSNPNLFFVDVEFPDFPIELDDDGGEDDEPKAFKVRLTRGKLESMLSFRSLVTLPIQRILTRADISVRDVDHVLLVGGGTRMLVVRRLIKQYFAATTKFKTDEKKQQPHNNDISQTQTQIHYNLNPCEVVAMGAATYAHQHKRRLIQKRLRAKTTKDDSIPIPPLIIPILPLSIGVAVNHHGVPGYMHTVIKRNSRMPVKQIWEFSPLHTDDESSVQQIDFQVFEGESRLVKNNHPLGKFSVQLVMAPRDTNLELETTPKLLESEPNTLDIKHNPDVNSTHTDIVLGGKSEAGGKMKKKKKRSRVRVEFSVDESGTLTISALDIQSKATKTLTMRDKDSQLDDKQVCEMMNRAKKLNGTEAVQMGVLYPHGRFVMLQSKLDTLCEHTAKLLQKTKLAHSKDVRWQKTNSCLQSVREWTQNRNPTQLSTQCEELKFMTMSLRNARAPFMEFYRQKNKQQFRQY